MREMESTKKEIGIMRVNKKREGGGGDRNMVILLIYFPYINESVSPV